MTVEPVDPPPSAADIRRWRRYLADERAEAAVYRDLATRRSGEEREILLALAEAERRHEEHWVALLGPHADRVPAVSVRTRVLGFFTRRFGSIFVLALAQRSEGRSPYDDEKDATDAMAADERIHAEVVRGLAARGRQRLAGSFRAAVFGANDGLVSNLALVLGIGATGVAPQIVLFTGIAGLLAGALSMAAGEYVSVRSQRELLQASTPDPASHDALSMLDLNANELALVYRARGFEPAEAERRAYAVLSSDEPARASAASHPPIDEHEEVGSATSAALSSFIFFASGAIIPVIPYLLGMSGLAAVVLATGLVSIALIVTGSIVGILSGASPVKRAARQLAIGLGAAAATYLLGLAFGTTLA